VGAVIMGAVIMGTITVIVAAAIISPIICLIRLMKTRIRRPEYFNIWYKPEHGTGFCRAHLVGKVYRLDNRALYLIEIHPEDAAKARAWTVPEAELRGVYLLEKGKFYKLAFEEELYD
jgi:hypothetical protein